MRTTRDVPSLRNTRFNQEGPMADGKRISIKLTPAQRAELEAKTGQSGAAIELDVEELEERIAPSFLGGIGDGLADPRPSPLMGDWVMLK